LTKINIENNFEKRYCAILEVHADSEQQLKPGFRKQVTLNGKRTKKKEYPSAGIF
jgi:hypothetical protein